MKFAYGRLPAIWADHLPDVDRCESAGSAYSAGRRDQRVRHGQGGALRRGTATDAAVYPVDHVPPPEVLKPAPGWEPLQEEASSDADGSPEADPAADGEAKGPLDLPAAEADARKRVKVFIYHSHNRESWVPELEGVTKLNDAYDANINITLLGKRLAERLEEEGIGTKVSDKDYPSAVKDFNYNKSYSYSLKAVQEAAATYPELTYYFDIHRDSQRRDLTTAEIETASLMHRSTSSSAIRTRIGSRTRPSRSRSMIVWRRSTRVYPAASMGRLPRQATVSTISISRLMRS